MAVVAEKLAAPAVRKTRADQGLWGWITTVDHKRVGVLYLAMGILFLVVGGIEALLIRLQLMRPENTLLVGEAYNRVLTQHGTVMIFFAATPIIWGLLNYFVPIVIGARDVAFPRLNMFTVWLTLFAGIILNAAWFMGGAADAGWFAYVPLSGSVYSPGAGMDTYLVAIQMAQLGSTLTAINFIVTILKMRAPGMNLMKMPPLAWKTLFMSGIVVTAGLPFMVGMLLLMFDRWFGTSFYGPGAGGDVTLWLQLFWLFGHPEVYILALPAFAAIDEVLPVFSRKPYFGYVSMVVAGAAIAAISWIVWPHHFYNIGLGSTANIFFSTTTKAVSVPTAIFFFNWIATIWGGRLRFKTPMLYALGFMFLFLVGGLTGIINASSATDRQFQNNYWIIAHFHYVAIGGIVFALLAGLSYWYPKMSGRMMNETLGKLGFWIQFIGFNLTFAPQFLAGLDGMPRRTYTYTAMQGWETYNLLSTIGALILALGIGIFAVNLVGSLFFGQKAGDDPWDARGLEWSIPSPAPAYNFARLPLVRGREALWYEKMHGNGRVQDAPDDLDEGRHGNAVHMPSPSVMPLVTGLGLAVALFGLGVLHSPAAAVLGGLVMVAGILGWLLENYSGYYLVEEEGDAA